MELSESVQRGLQSLADPSSFDRRSYQVLVDVSFRSLLSSQADPSVLDQPELKQIDQILLKMRCVAAVSCLEELSFSADRIEIFYSTHQEHRKEVERLLASIGRCPPHIHDASWCLQYHVKNDQVDKINEPFYLISLNTEVKRSSDDINFTCTVEQLQDLVGKLKDAAKSVEKASQM
uniref:COMM domain-containing protein 3 n=1 Tax=Gasterosteus aculeatus aculeatus TaxID=481459 RepID=A0AAQ4RKN4_GASAC